jgi:hypothetical protein
MPKTAMSIAEAQHNMRYAYLSGAPGMLASALAWLVAGIVALQASPQRAVLALFVGGMLIHPAGVLLAKALGRPGSHTRGNPLGNLAMESTIFMLLCLPISFAISQMQVQWFFPAMLLVIGGRYLTFSTLFGMRIYWAVGAALAAAAYLLVILKATPAAGAFAGSLVELLFALIIFFIAKTTSPAQASPKPD